MKVSRRSRAVAAVGLAFGLLAVGVRVVMAQAGGAVGVRAQKDRPHRGALRIARLRHAGDANIDPMAIPNLTTALRAKLNFNVVIDDKEVSPRDPALVHYPLVYFQGRDAIDLDAKDLTALRRHLSPGGGTLFADAACGSPAFDAAFRRFVAELVPGQPLVPIPHDDAFYTRKPGNDLSDVKRTPAAGGNVGYPELEGVMGDGHWAIIYSKYDISSALGKQADANCKGYTQESALKIVINVVLSATSP